ncbi:MAG: hypothetical protein V1662_03830 [Candidatus Omnitrophota bacterium]
MKETLLVLFSVLLLVFGGLAMFSGNEDYAAEKLFYQAMQIDRKIAKNPEIAPVRMIVAVERNLKKIIEEYPHNKMVKPARMGLVELYLTHQKYVEVIPALDEVITQYKDDLFTVSKARFLKGAAYEKQGQWEKAAREWSVLRGEKYTNTPWGLQVPFYIGNCYQQKKNYPQAEKAYTEAVVFYRDIESANKGTPKGYTAANLLLLTYMQMERYEEAGKTAERIVDTYNNQLTLFQQLANIDLIFVRILHQPDKAIEIYNKIKAKTDEPKLIRSLEQRISELTAQKWKRPET